MQAHPAYADLGEVTSNGIGEGFSVHAGVWADPDRFASRLGMALRATADQLSSLGDDGWVVLTDLQRPGRRMATLGHVAVGPGGVVVIDTREWAGQVDVEAGMLRQNGRSRDRECELAQGSAAAVSAWLAPAHRTAVRSVIALAGQPTPASQPAGTAVYGIEDLADRLRRLPARLSPADVWAVADHLHRTLADGSVPVQLTTASLAAALLTPAAGDGSTAPARTGRPQSIRRRWARVIRAWRTHT